MIDRRMVFLGMLAAVALNLSGCASPKSIRLLNQRIDSVRVEARDAADRAYAMSQMTPAEAESMRLGARDVAVIKALTDMQLRVSRSGYSSCQANSKDLKEYVEDIQSQLGALRAANATLRSELESCRKNAGRIDGYWRSAQDDATYYKNESEDCAKKLSTNGRK